MSDASTLTTLLWSVRDGDIAARDKLAELVYPELRRLASYYMRAERPDHTLQATALVHEAFVRLFDGQPVSVRDRTHFVALVARQMRRILVDYGRAFRAAKAPGSQIRLALDDVSDLGDAPDEDLLAVDEALERLSAVDDRAARVVELRFFGGLSEEETGEVLGISLSTVKRDWTFARAWLLKALSSQ
jgi:RNA polymerase sigma factor (TIGR02999 family)